MNPRTEQAHWDDEAAHLRVRSLRQTFTTRNEGDWPEWAGFLAMLAGFGVLAGAWMMLP